MTFDPQKVNEFKVIFETYKSAIRHSEGCIHLELLEGINDKSNVLFTFSRWNSEEDLNTYRHSSTFKEVWPLTKALFISKAEAWSTKAQEVSI